MTFRAVRLVGLLCILCLSGCAITTGHANVDYAPEDADKSPLSTLSPMTVYLKVVDKRPVGQRDRVGNKENTFGMKMAPIKLEKDATEILYDALKHEFTNNGHTVVASPDSNPDISVEVALSKMWADMKARFIDIQVTGTISTNISINDSAGGSLLEEKSLITTTKRSEQIASSGAVERTLNDTLSEYVRNFSRDMDILNALRSARK